MHPEKCFWDNCVLSFSEKPVYEKLVAPLLYKNTTKFFFVIKVKTNLLDYPCKL